MDYKVLVVDSEEENCAILAHFLQHEGFHAEYEMKVDKVLKRIINENFKIVLCNLILDKMDGIQVLKKIKEYDAGTEVIMMSGYATITNILRCRKNGAYGFLFKPFGDLSEVKDEITKAIDESSKWEKVLLKRKNFSSIMNK